MSEIKKTIVKTEEIARKIWLAGLGAYGQGIDNVQSGYDKVQSSYDKVNSETKSLFEKLVSRGEELENLTLKTIKDTRGQAVNKTNSTIRAQGELLASQGEKLKSRAEKIQEINVEDLSLDKLTIDKLSMDNLSDRISETINTRLDEIRNRVNDIIPNMVTRKEFAELSEKIDKLAPKPKARSTRAKKAATPKDTDQTPE